MPGGRFQIKTTDPELQQAVQFAIDVVNKIRGYSCESDREVLVNITHATSQCRGCPEKQLIMKAVLVLSAFLVILSIDINYVIGAKIVRQIPGGVNQIDGSNAELRASETFAVDEVNRLRGYSGMTYREVMINATHPTYQVVSGWMYRFEMDLGISFCTNNVLNEGANTTRCAVQSGLPVRHCSVAVWNRPWLQPEYVLHEHHCVPSLGRFTVSPLSNI
ncbi:hypothetical protein ScPMuIL_008405 [Solemya velum]